MLWPPIVKMLSHYLDHKTYVTANLVVTSAAHAATILLYVYVPICLSFMSWQTVFFTASVLSLCSVLIFAITLRIILPEKPKGREVEAQESCSTESNTAKTTEEVVKISSGKSIFAILRDTGVLTIFICVIVCGFLRDGIESWLPTLYSEAFNRDASESILVSVILPVFSIISITVITALHKGKLFSNELVGSSILFGGSIILAIPLVFLVDLEGTVYATISLVLTALICAAMHGVNFLLISCLPGRFSGMGRAATVSGVCNSCVYVGAAISMYGIAMVSQAIGWSLTIATWILLCALGILFSSISYKKYTAMINQED